MRHLRKEKRTNPSKTSLRKCTEALDKLESVYEYSRAHVTRVEGKFVFAHFTSEKRADAIMVDGFLGRGALDVHRHGSLTEPSTLSSEGYIFAYKLAENSVDEAVWGLYDTIGNFKQVRKGDPFDRPFTLMFKSVVLGVSYGGLEISRDEETQYILPIACIERDSIVQLKDLDEMFPEYIFDQDI